MSSRQLPELPAAAEFVGHDSVSSDEVVRLRRELSKTRKELSEAEAELSEVRKQLNDARRAMASLRKVLSPLRGAIGMIFGELDAAGVEASSDAPVETVSVGQPIPASVFSAWKERLPPSCGKIIDALLIHPMNSTQLRTACKLGSTSVSVGLGILRKNNLVEYDGSLNRLKRP